jgi:MFS transporter, DHA2 family, multidrug resistance protein
MTAAALQAVPLTRRSASPWLVAVAVVIPTFMEVLDTTIANVALRYIAGGLSAANVDSEWVITSYLAANAIILPISGWLALRLGRRNYFLLSIAVFTFASAMCGMAGSLTFIIAARAIQGMAGGGLQPSSQAVLLDAFPQEKQGQAMTVFGMAALLAPVVGPTLGGYITDTYGWRWIFYLNVPIGILAFFLCHALVTDPEYMEVERAKNRAQGQPFDTLGLCLLVVTMVCWEVMLSKGEQWDWLGDPFYRVQTLVMGFVLGLSGLIYRELRLPSPLIPLRALRDRNFATCCIVIFCAYGILYANTISLPALLQSLFGYDATTSGLVLSPSGIFAVLMMVVIGAALARGFDARYLMAGGLITMSLGNYWMALQNLDIGPWQVVWPRVVVIAGLSMLFAPLNVAAFIYLPKEIRGAAVGLLALLRNEGGSVGTSVAQIIQERREQFHTLRLNEGLDTLNPSVNNLLTRSQSFFLQHNGDVTLSHQMAVGVLNKSLAQQASSLAYFDVFSVSAAVGVVLVFSILLMRRSVAEKGAHIGAE